jgi:hypothetical protein
MQPETTPPHAGLKTFLSKWLLVIIGVCMAIASAVISNYFIAKSHDQITEWEYQVKLAEQYIEETWENSRSLERRKDTAIILAISDREDQQVQQFIDDTLRLMNNELVNDYTYDTIQTSFDLYKFEVIERINDKYLELQNYIDQIRETRNHNDVLMNIALCFQILGLIFVLSKGVI